MKKIITSILAVLMFFGLATVNVNAEEDNVKQYDRYISIGDSITRGYTLNHASDLDYRVVEGSYPYLVADAIGCEPATNDQNDIHLFSTTDINHSYYPVSAPGLTLASAMDLFGIGEGEDTVYGHGYVGGGYEKLLYYFGDESSIAVTENEKDIQEYYLAHSNYEEGTQGGIHTIISKQNSKKLITVELGLADIGIKPIVSVIDIMSGTDYSYLSKQELVLKTLELLREEVSKSYEEWRTNYGAFISYLKQLDPNADIVLVGYMNTFRQITLANNTIVPIGNIFTPIVSKMNRDAKNIADNLGCIFVDVSDAESKATEEDWSLVKCVIGYGSTLCSHPTANSYAYMARQIINALPMVDSEGVEYKATHEGKIVIDLIRYNENEVKDVILDGRILSRDEYSVNGTILTVPCTRTNAKQLQVIAEVKEGEETKTAVRTYLLTYTDGEYTARCIDIINDLDTNPRKVITNIANINKSIIESIHEKFERTPEPEPDHGEIVTIVDVVKEVIRVLPYDQEYQNFKAKVEENFTNPEKIIENIDIYNKSVKAFWDNIPRIKLH